MQSSQTVDGSYGFSSSHVWIECLTVKKTVKQIIDAFELWCWRKLLRVCWAARRSNQSTLKEINLEYSLEGLMLILKLQYIGHLMWKNDYWKRSWCWERLKTVGEGNDRGWDDWMESLTWWMWAWASFGSWWWTGKHGVLLSMGSEKVRHNWVPQLTWTAVLTSFLILMVINAYYLSYHEN